MIVIFFFKQKTAYKFRISDWSSDLCSSDLPEDLPDHLLSSGEDAWQHLKTRPDAWYRALGTRCYHLGPARDLGMREGLDLTFVDSLAEADFILNTGVLPDLDQVDTYRHFLDEGLARRLPMICADRKSTRPNSSN